MLLGRFHLPEWSFGITLYKCEAWGSFKQNGEDMVKHGRSRVGSKNHKAKLSEKDVPLIKEMYKSNRFSQQRIADLFGVSQPRISSIMLGKTWKHVQT